MTKKVYTILARETEDGYFSVYPNLYVCLVSKQGLARKSVGKDIACDLFTECFPDAPQGASVQSCQDIIKFMASDECLDSFKDEQGTIQPIRPIVFFVNELKNFLSVDPIRMIDFLTDIYDRKRFRSSTIKRGLEDIENPCVNILACETPAWITERLKSNIISGGFSRRMIYVYETHRGKRIALPARPPGSREMWARLKAHLFKVSKLVGRFSWTPEALTFWEEWYVNLAFPEDEIMAGFYESKHIQAIKVAMLLAMAEEEPKLLLTVHLLKTAIAMLDSLEENLPKLTAGAGRSGLSIPIQNLLDLLEKHGGLMKEKEFNRVVGKDLEPAELMSVKKYLERETEQIVFANVRDPSGVTLRMVLLKEKWLELKHATDAKKTMLGGEHKPEDGSVAPS